VEMQVVGTYSEAFSGGCGRGMCVWEKKELWGRRDVCGCVVCELFSRTDCVQPAPQESLDSVEMVLGRLENSAAPHRS
jgi:hypothetical protein